MAVHSKIKKKESFLETVKTFVSVVLIVVVVRTFAFEPFNIPSGSMIPALLVGDYIFVSKFSYGYSKYSFPLINPPFSGRIFGSLPRRGDVAVFRKPTDTSTVYVKRIMGLPGDKIQMIDGQLYINGETVKNERVGDYIDNEYGPPDVIPQFIETLPEGLQHPILHKEGLGGLDNTPVFVVPEGHVFGMGDNRSNSLDSRALSEVGYIPVENLIGKAEFKFFSSDPNIAAWWQFWNWPFAIRYSRIFQGIH